MHFHNLLLDFFSMKLDLASFAGDNYFRAINFAHVQNSNAHRESAFELPFLKTSFIGKAEKSSSDASDGFPVAIHHG